MDMSYDFALDASKSDLENKVKVRYEPGPIRHRLYEIFEEAGQPVARQKFAWMYYAGMGDVDLYDANKKYCNVLPRSMFFGQQMGAECLSLSVH